MKPKIGCRTISPSRLVPVTAFMLICGVALIPSSPFVSVAGFRLKIDEIILLFFVPYLFFIAIVKKWHLDSQSVLWLGMLTFWYVSRASLNLTCGGTFRDLNPALIILIMNLSIVLLANYLNQKADAWRYVYIGLWGGLLLVMIICGCQLFGSKTFDIWLMDHYTNEYITWSKFNIWGRVSGPFENESNYLAAYLAVIIAYLGGKWLISSPQKRRWSVAAVLLCALALLTITSGRTAQLALIFGLLVLSLLSGQPFKLFIPAIAVALALWITKEVGYYRLLQYRWGLLNAGLQEESIANRIIRWTEAFSYLESSWLKIFFGMGTRVDYTDTFLIMDSSYVDIYWSYGLLGVFLFLIFIVSLGWRVWKIREFEPRISFITMITVFLLCGTTGPFLLSRRIYPLVLLLYFGSVGSRYGRQGQ